MSMFTDDSYKAITYTYGDYSVTLQALETTATDYDLTGQVVWQAADIFAKFMLEGDTGKDLFQGRKVLEVGSGPGLGGFIVSKWASMVILSDYQDVVLDLMESNIAKYNHNAATCDMYACKIDWNEMREEGRYGSVELLAEDGTVAGTLGDQQLDAVIGTDVIYWRDQIEPLINTLGVISNKNPGIKIYICYVERHTNTHNELKAVLARHNFTLTEFGQETTKPINEHSYMYLI